MKNEEGYKILSDVDPDELTRKVQESMREGWWPWGDLVTVVNSAGSIRQDLLCQVVYFQNDEEDSE